MNIRTLESNVHQLLGRDYSVACFHSYTADLITIHVSRAALETTVSFHRMDLEVGKDHTEQLLTILKPAVDELDNRLAKQTLRKLLPHLDLP